MACYFSYESETAIGSSLGTGCLAGHIAVSEEIYVEYFSLITFAAAAMNRKAAPTVASRSLRRIFQSEKLIRILIAIAALLFFQCFSIPLFASKVAQLRTFPGTSFSCLICHHSYFDIIQGHSISRELMHFHQSISQFESLFEAVYILINYFGWYSTEEKSGCNNLYGWFLISFCRGSNNDCVWYRLS